MTKRIPSYRTTVAVLVAAVTILAIFVSLKITNAQSSVIPEGLAVDRALNYAQEDGRVGGATAKPAEIRGQVMTYDQAVQFIYGKPIAANDAIAKARDYPVWLLLLRGKFIEHVPAAADGSVPARDVIHTQMAVILDGNTGEEIERIMLPPQKALSVSNLPVLAESSGALPALPTKGPISTEVPYPTVSPQ